MKKISCLIFILASQVCFAWDATGHRIIAAIAYQYLTPQTKAVVNQYTALMSDSHNPWKRFLTISVWPDTLYSAGKKQFKQWHFIDYPIVRGDRHYHTYYPKYNAVWAISHCEKELHNGSISRQLKSQYLSFLVHVTGDVHQPLHCASLYSPRFPKGDAGGNLYLIKSRKVKNLHHLWDQGVGLFRIKGQRYPLSNKNINRLAGKIQKEFSRDRLSAKIADHNPADWAHESYRLAKTEAYSLPYNGKPDSQYVTLSQRIVAERIALAGYRLASVLNQLFGGPR